jgi:uncharacterized protein YjdB
VSAASDQYSLGLVAYELLTGRPPFSGSPFVVMHAHTERPAPPIREQRPDCDPELDAAIQRMLAKDPQQRWPSVQHALAALNAAPLGDGDPDRLALAQLSLPAPFRRSDEVLRPGASPTPEPATGAKAPGDVKPYVAAVEIFAPPSIVEVGDIFTLSGSPRNPSGDTVPGVRLRWSSSNEQVATVDETRGTVQAISAGDVQITATVGGVHNEVRLTIVPKRVATISVSLPPGVLRAGDRVQLVATPEDKRHEQVHTAVHWASADEAIAVVSQDGVVSAKSPGEVLVWAESQGVRAMARIEVSPAPVVTVTPVVPSVLEVGESAELSAKTLDAAGQQLDRPVRWSSSDASVAEIIGDRVVRAKSAGVARITCNCEGKLATTEVAIVLPVVTKILIEPPPAKVDLGLPVPLHADVVSARGVRIDRPLHWKAEPANVASVDAKGVVLPLREGRAVITASVDGVEASVRLEVNPPPELAFPLGDVSATQVIELEEARRLLARSDPRASIASLRAIPEPVEEEAVAAPLAHFDDAASPVDGASVDAAAPSDTTDDPSADATIAAPEAVEPWQSVSAPTYMDLAGANRFAFIDRIGRKRLAGAGAGVLVLALITWGLASRKSTPVQQVVATNSGSFADSAAQAKHADSTLAAIDSQPKSVTPPPDTTASATTKLTIMPLKPLHVGDTAVLRAKLAGDPKAQLGAVTWSSSAPKIARIDQRTGRLIAVKEGSATITGTANGTKATIQLRVVPGPSVVLAGKVAVAQIFMSDIKSTLHPGDTVRITAAPVDAKGSSLVDRKVTWQSTHPEVATVDAFGLVTARGPGSAEILATSEQQTARVPVTVTARTVTFPDATSALRSGADRFLAALGNHDVRQLTAAMYVDSPDDQKNLDWLLDKARSSDANLHVTRAPQASRVNTRDAEATQDFVFTLAWTAPNGQSHESKYKFRARSTRADGGVWSAATLRALDKLE